MPLGRGAAEDPSHPGADATSRRTPRHNPHHPPTPAPPSGDATASLATRSQRRDTRVLSIRGRPMPTPRAHSSRPRTALPVALLAVLLALPGRAADPPSRPASGPGPAPGLDVIQRRPITDSWVLRYQEVYDRGRDPKQEKRLRDVLASARARHKPGQVEVPIDHDQDGVAEHWVYFAKDVPAFLEEDRFGTGCHDLRVDLRGAGWKASEFGGWALEPPLPLAPTKH